MRRLVDRVARRLGYVRADRQITGTVDFGRNQRPYVALQLPGGQRLSGWVDSGLDGLLHARNPLFDQVANPGAYVDDFDRGGQELGPDWVFSAQHQAGMWREACTITTVEQLDALPDGATVRDGDGVVLSRNPKEIFPGRERPWWPLSGYTAYDRDFGVGASDVPLPALLIWHPGWEKP